MKHTPGNEERPNKLGVRMKPRGFFFRISGKLSCLRWNPPTFEHSHSTEKSFQCFTFHRFESKGSYRRNEPDSLVSITNIRDTPGCRRQHGVDTAASMGSSLAENRYHHIQIAGRTEGLRVGAIEFGT